jgi:hypothetical protein
MTSRDFCYWLQGFFELSKEPGLAPSGMTSEQIQLIKQHLALVFVHEIDPSAGGPVEQAKLNAVHDGMTKEEVEKAIADALSKLPKPNPYPPGGPVMRC